MWIHREHYDSLKAENAFHRESWITIREEREHLVTQNTDLLGQKAKDDITIDWMRHRINALEKQNAVLLQKAAGVVLPVPEIVPTRPGTLSKMELPDFGTMPSFEDVGDDEAARMGIVHDDDGSAVYIK